MSIGYWRDEPNGDRLYVIEGMWHARVKFRPAYIAQIRDWKSTYMHWINVGTFETLLEAEKECERRVLIEAL